MMYFVDSFNLAHDKVDNLKYIIVGQGEDEEVLKKKVADGHNQDNIIFLGYRPDIQNIMSQMDYVVLSSLWEGLPLTPIEAFSMHKPVIGTAVDGTKEIINNGVNGFLIAPKDPQAIAEKVIELALSTEKRSMMGENAYMTYQKMFGFDVFKDNILNFYRQTLNLGDKFNENIVFCKLYKDTPSSCESSSTRTSGFSSIISTIRFLRLSTKALSLFIRHTSHLGIYHFAEQYCFASLILAPVSPNFTALHRAHWLSSYKNSNLTCAFVQAQRDFPLELFCTAQYLRVYYIPNRSLCHVFMFVSFIKF